MELERGTIEDYELEDEELDDGDSTHCHAVAAPGKAKCGAPIRGRRQHAMDWIRGRCQTCHRPTCADCERIVNVRALD